MIKNGNKIELISCAIIDLSARPVWNLVCVTYLYIFVNIRIINGIIKLIVDISIEIINDKK